VETHRSLRPVCTSMVALLAVVAGCAVRPHDTRLPVPPGGPAAPTSPAAQAAAGHVVVVAPGWLTPFLQDVRKEYQQGAPGVRVVVREAKPGETEGAPADVVVSPAGPELAAAGVDAAADKLVIGRIPLVLAVPRGNPLKLKSLEALAKSDKAHVAVPDPKRDGAGETCVAALQKAGRWETLEARVVSVPSSGAARQALEGGQVQAAVSYAPPVVFAGGKSKIGLGFFIPAEVAAPVDLVAVRRGTNAAAGPVIEYLRSARAQALLVKHGFVASGEAPAVGSGKSLLVLCGAGLQPAMDVIGAEYQKRTGVRVDFSYAGAQMLLGQLAFSRHGDLYMPGEGFWVMQAVKRGYVQEYKPVVYFTPVIMVPKGNPKGVRTVQDMARPGVRVALGHPEALAVGPLTKRILQRAGVWEKVQPNVVMEAGCIPELTNAVVMKGADAGIMWDASALQVKEHVDIVPIAPKLNEVAEVLLATLRFSTDPAEAKRFLDFVASDDAQAIFERMQFRTQRPAGIRLAPLEGPGGGSK
jgi:molybdate transport system substrate-binding protein